MKTVFALLSSVVVVAACAGGTASAPPSASSPAASASTAAPTATPTLGPATPSTDPGDARLIAYQRWVASGTTTIALVGADGADDHLLEIDGLPGDDLAHPDWSPDGAVIAFDIFMDEAATPGKQRVEPWQVSADGGTGARLASCELPCLQQAYPTWSPDGTRLALLRYDVAEDDTWGPSALEVIDVATGERRLIAETADGLEAWYFPRWSPDGSSIAMVVESYTDSEQETYTGMWIATVPVAGDGAGTLTRVTGSDVFPREVDWGWANDRLIISSIPSLTSPIEEARLITMRPDGSDVQSLLGPGGADVLGYQPAWDPGGDGIVFTSVEGRQAPTLGVLRGTATDPTYLTDIGWPRTHGRIQPPR